MVDGRTGGFNYDRNEVVSVLLPVIQTFEPIDDLIGILL